MQTDLLTTAEAAKVLGVSSETVRRWAAAKRLRHITSPSGRLMFDRDDLAGAYKVVEPASPDAVTA